MIFPATRLLGTEEHLMVFEIFHRLKSISMHKYLLDYVKPSKKVIPGKRCIFLFYIAAELCIKTRPYRLEKIAIHTTPVLR